MLACLLDWHPLGPSTSYFLMVANHLVIAAFCLTIGVLAGLAWRRR